MASISTVSTVSSDAAVMRNGRAMGGAPNPMVALGNPEEVAAYRAMGVNAAGSPTPRAPAPVGPEGTEARGGWNRLDKSRTGASRVFGVPLDEPRRAKLDAAAMQAGVSSAELVRRLIDGL